MSGCQHYQRRCVLMAPCCKKYFACRLCHNEEVLDHEMERNKVTEIKCSQCETEQKVSSHCDSCGIKFGRYFCEICRLFDDIEKGQFHCDGCGICRIGGKDNYFHCNKCDMCLGVQLRESHKCVENSSHAPCPVCLEDIHTSRIPAQVPPCGHLIHGTCYKALLSKMLYTCPLCSVSLVDMKSVWRRLDTEIEHTPMPEEYLNYIVSILCKDCQMRSHVAFHVLGLKCSHCGSYNTCRDGEDLTSPPASASPLNLLVLRRGQGEAVEEPRVPPQPTGEQVAGGASAQDNGEGTHGANPGSSAEGEALPDDDDGWVTVEEEEVADADDIDLGIVTDSFEVLDVNQINHPPAGS